jgi:hypothetical protein
MTTHLPPAAVNLDPPDAAEVLVLSRGIESAVSQAGLLTETQQLLLGAICHSMTGYAATLGAAPMTAQEFAEALSNRAIEFRSRIVQLMVLLGLVLRPIPPGVVASIAAFASALEVEEGMVEVAQQFASGSLGLAAFDFERNGYTSEWVPEHASALHTSGELASAWDACVADPALAAQWRDMERLAPGTMGRRITEFYRARGFAYPGQPGSAPPLLAQHDWVHVLADYGTTVESELEVFAFIARANDDMRAFSLLAMVVSLFETGYLRTGAGLFEASPGHLSEHGMAARVGDAMRRGASCRGSIDYLLTDWFDLAELRVEEAREHFGVVDKDPEAVESGAVGPWEPGGISPFQLTTGTAQARNERRPYESYGAAAN